MGPYSLKKLSHWIWFSFLLSLVPLFASIWRINGQSSKEIFIIMKDVVCNGELILICMALLAASIGEVVKDEPTSQNAKIWIIGGSLALIIFSVIIYSDIKFFSFEVDYVWNTSVAFLIGSVFLSLSSVIIPKQKENG